MKLLIDIDKNDYEYMKNGYVPLTFNTFSVIKNGIPIPNNATNGDVIKTMFMPNQITRTGDDTVHMEYDFTPEWWNAPYQKGDER